MNKLKYYICPICGYDKLDESPYDETGEPSFEICPCCGIEFGCDLENFHISENEYRKKWLSKGGIWFDPCEQPEEWDLELQLKNIKKED